MDKRFGAGGADPGPDWPVGTWAFCVTLMHRCFVERGTWNVLLWVCGSWLSIAIDVRSI